MPWNSSKKAILLGRREFESNAANEDEDENALPPLRVFHEADLC
jgi:hypothetical protein